MVRVNLKGLHSTPKTLADGSRRTYWYAWRGGPRLMGEPGSPEFMASLEEARLGATHRAKRETLEELCLSFEASPDFPQSAGSAKDYRRHLATARAEFGQMTFAEIEAKGSRTLFLEWRDEMARERGARTADYAIIVLARCLSWAKHREILDRNPLEKIGRLHTATRAESVWTLEEEAALHAKASAPISLACRIAAETGQRQADILAMTWTAYDGRSLLVRQSKTGAAVRVPVSSMLKKAIDATAKRSPFIVTTQRAKRGSSGEVYAPYSSDGFRSSFAAVMAEAGIESRTFHDFRGTFATRSQEAGATQAEVAACTGHGQSGNVLSVSYTSYTYAMAEACIRKLDQWHMARTNLQTTSQTGERSRQDV